MADDRRVHPRLPTSARALWHVAGDDFLQLDRMRDISDTGAYVETESLARAGAIVRFEILGDDESRIAEGTARVVWADPARGMGIEFLTLDVSAAKVAASQPPRPPPLPGGRRDDEPAPEIEPLIAPRPTGMVIGIDLGTTNTCASYVQERQPVIIPGRTGTSTIPSMVNFAEDGAIHVGQRAADRQILYPTRTVYGSKRLIGRTYREEQARELQARFAYPLGEAEDQRYGVRVDDFVIGMDVIATRILEDVKRTAEDYLGMPVQAAVITVPAYFSEAQREAVRRAAAAAELEVQRIVNEPTAAAVAYGHRRQDQSRVAVWDLGGGTFDFSVVNIENERFEVVATGGDNFVGGGDFDDLLASHLFEEFSSRHGVESLEPTSQQVARLREAAELAKRALSVETEYDVRLLEFTREPKRDLMVTVTRERFDELTSPLVARTVQIVRGVLLDAQLTPEDIDDVVLVGGSTRVPAVQTAVEALFGRRPSRRINPDEAVALGAALLADELGSEDGPTLSDILPMTVGRAVEGCAFEAIAPRGTRLPFTRELVVPADFLGTVMVPLFQGESPDAANNEYLCSITVQHDGLRDGGHVRVTLSFDEHCVMAVQAHDAASGRGLEVELERDRPVDDILRELGLYQGEPAAEEWKLPESRVGAFFGKLFGMFRR